jgi:hypothetical protein
MSKATAGKHALGFPGTLLGIHYFKGLIKSVVAKIAAVIL